MRFLAILSLFAFTVEPGVAQDGALTGRGLRFHAYDPAPGFMPAAINDRGEIAGNHPEHGPMLIRPDGTVIVLGITGSVAAMNNAGQLVINRDGATYLRQPEGKEEPRTVAGAKIVSGLGLNSLGQMVGSADRDAVMWEADGTSRVIPIPLGWLTLTDNGPRTATGINDAGLIFGGFHYPYVWGGYILTGDTFFRHVASGKFGTASGISNTGDSFYSYYDYGPAERRNTALLNAEGKLLYRGSDEPWFTAITPDGTRLIAQGFIAESCATSVKPSATAFPLVGGRLHVAVSADADCRWSANGLTQSWVQGNHAVNVLIPASEQPQLTRVTVAGAGILIAQGGGECESVLPGTHVYAAGDWEFRIPVATGESCAWSVEGFGPGVIAEPPGGTGPAEVTLKVSANPSCIARYLTGTIAGQPFTVYQPGRGCESQASR